MELTTNYDYNRSSEPYTCDFRTDLEAGNSDFHMHNYHEIFLLLEGQINYFVEQSCYSMEDGDLILFSNHEIHKVTNLTGNPFSRIVLHINPFYIRPYCTPKTNLLGCFGRKSGVANQISLKAEERQELVALASHLEGCKHGEGYGSDIVALSLIFQILVLVNRVWQRNSNTPTQPAPHRAQAIMKYIDQHLATPMTLDSIAHDLSLDKYYLSHLFKNETESSIFQYILVKRVALAKELLAQGMNVTEACHGSGFNDYSNFIRSFRLTTGYTPGQFKKGVVQEGFWE